MVNEAVLSAVVEGVQFAVSTERGEFKAVVLAEMLIARFGAGPSPQSWLQTYHAHWVEMRQAAIRARSERPGSEWVVLRPDSVDTSVGLEDPSQSAR